MSNTNLENNNSTSSYTARYGEATTTYPDGMIKNTQDAVLSFNVPQDQVKGLVVFVHGGGWVTGNTDAVEANMEKLKEQGYAVLSVGYRLAYNRETGISEGGEYPNNINDVKAALTTVMGTSEPNGDSLSDEERQMWEMTKSFADKNLLLSGMSAGAHLVASATTQITVEDPSAVSKISGVLLIAGPQDIRDPAVFNPNHWNNVLVPYIGGQEEADKHPVGSAPGEISQEILEKISPTATVENNPDAPWNKIAWFSVYADNDGLVPEGSVSPFVDAIRNSGGIIENYVVNHDTEGGGHNITPEHVGDIIALLPEYTARVQNEYSTAANIDIKQETLVQNNVNDNAHIASIASGRTSMTAAAQYDTNSYGITASIGLSGSFNGAVAASKQQHGTSIDAEENKNYENNGPRRVNSHMNMTV